MPSLHPSPSAEPTPGRLFIFDTHPIQYRSPVFREIFARHKDFKVFLFNAAYDSSVLWLKERKQIPDQKWNLPLLEGFPCEILSTREMGWVKFSRFLGEALEAQRPAAVLTYGYFQWEHWILWWHCQRKGIPLLFVGESFVQKTSWLRQIIKGTLVRAFFKGVRGFISIGKKNLAYYETLGVPSEKIHPARYCVDEKFFHLPVEKASQVRREWREKHQIPAEARVVLFVGRLVERKRPRDLLEMHRLLSHHPWLHTCVIGNGPLEEDLRQSAKSLPRVHFLGFQDQEQARAAYHGSDVLVVPSEYETWGLVVNESFLGGCPAVVTDTCGCAYDLVVPGETGEIFPVGDVKMASQKIDHILSDPARREALGKLAQKKSLSQYDTAQFAKSILSAAARVGVTSP